LAGSLADPLIRQHLPQAALVPGGREPGIKPGNCHRGPVAAAVQGRVYHVPEAKPVPVKPAHAELGGHLGHRPLQERQQRDHSRPGASPHHIHDMTKT
jgi:hypothetical protein